ncbi:MAG: hypothetical protein ACLSA1_08160 [Alphaproteobacteria bacterium]
MLREFGCAAVIFGNFFIFPFPVASFAAFGLICFFTLGNFNIFPLTVAVSCLGFFFRNLDILPVFIGAGLVFGNFDIFPAFILTLGLNGRTGICGRSSFVFETSS